MDRLASLIFMVIYLSEHSCCTPTIELTEITRTQTILLLECLTKCSMGCIASRQRDFGNIYRAHSQFAPSTFQPNPPDVSGDILTDAACKDAMQVRHREISNCCQRFPMQWFIQMLADVFLNRLNALCVVLKVCQH